MKNKLKLSDVIISFLVFFLSRIIFDKFMEWLCVKKDYDILLLGNRLAFVLIFVFMIVFFLFFRYSQSHKTQKLIATFSIMIISVATIISINTVTIVDDDIIVKNYWGLKKQIFELDDISRAELSLVTVNTKWHTESLKYELFFPEDQDVTIIVSNCFFKDNDGLILFDKRISKKRIVKDDLSQNIFEIDKQTESFYDYFSNIDS